MDVLILSIEDVLYLRRLILAKSDNKNILRRVGIEDSLVYSLTGLDPQHSEEIFCLHAFVLEVLTKWLKSLWMRTMYFHYTLNFLGFLSSKQLEKRNDIHASLKLSKIHSIRSIYF